MSSEKCCLFCQKIFTSKYKQEKYCSLDCARKFNNRKQSELFKSNADLRKKKNEYEKERIKRVGRNRDRLKHNLQEKIRYRKKNNILSDEDLKILPKGSGTLTKHGYRQIIKHGHPNARRGGGMFEHVFIMSEFLQRPLKKGETVHHKNGIRHDNRIENLELWSSSHPYGQRIEDKLKWCIEFLTEYGYDVIKKEI